MNTGIFLRQQHLFNKKQIIVFFLQTLRKKERDAEHEMERLAREKIAAQQRIVALKKELSATWDHIDFNTLLQEQNFGVDPSGPKNGKSKKIPKDFLFFECYFLLFKFF